jgi:KDO2-lipid IV(A) lauroyltransferase
LDSLAPALLALWTRLLALLPYAASRRVGRFLGAVAYHLRSRARRVTELNLALAMPEMGSSARDALVRESLKHTGCLLAETGITFRWSAERLDRLVLGVEGFEPLARALVEKRGILVLAPHYGNWELFALHFGRYHFTALYDPPRIRALEAPVRASRERTGARLLPIDASGVRSVFTALRSGQPVSLLPDQVPERRAGVYAPFFGRPALTMSFAHRLIRATRPLVVFGSCRRERDGFRIQFVEAPPAIHSERVEVSAAALNEGIEALVRSDPAQYQWEYKRYKRPPPGTADPYRRSPSEATQ